MAGAPVSPLPGVTRVRPVPTEFPTPDTTGVRDRSLLRVHEGDLVVEDDGAVVENLEINGTLEVRGARDVLIRNVHVYTSGFWTVYTTQGGSLTIEDAEIGHPDHIGQRGLGGHDVTARRLDIHHVEDAIKVGNNSTYDWVVCRDLASLADDPHYDCVQDDGGASNALFTRVSLDPTPVAGYERGDRSNGNAAWFIKSDLGPIDNVTIRDSFIEGGGFSIFAQAGSDHPAPSNVRVINNRFGDEQAWGLLYEEPFIVWYHNVWDATGDAVYRDGASPPTVAPFDDITGSEDEEAISWLYWAGIVDGCDERRFCPHEAMSRGDMAIWLATALAHVGPSVDRFDDDGGAVESAADILAAAGIVEGCTDSSLCPDAVLTIQDAAGWLGRAFDLPAVALDYFSDDAGRDAEPAINALAAAGITTGCAPGMVCVDEPLTRGEAATLLRRALG